jgi:hypothetical protein
VIDDVCVMMMMMMMMMIDDGWMNGLGLLLMVVFFVLPCFIYKCMQAAARNLYIGRSK